MLSSQFSHVLLVVEIERFYELHLFNLACVFLDILFFKITFVLLAFINPWATMTAWRKSLIFSWFEVQAETLHDRH